MLQVGSTRRNLITVEIDGAASSEEVRQFADRSRVPLGLRSGYVRFAMRTIVGVAPTAYDLEDAFTGIAIRDLSVNHFPDMPLLIATATAV